MKEYKGAVFFVDILGIGALTQSKIEITEDDFRSHKFKGVDPYSEHQFCAKLLMKFRRVLNKVMKSHRGLKVAQLSDCAFVWSADAALVTEAARQIMWETISNGVLCRGGMSYGEIVEPDSVNTYLGKFICGKAATQAVKLESTGKGARVFIDTEIPAKVFKTIPSKAFKGNKNPIDCLMIDEFMWYLFPDTIDLHAERNNLNIMHKLKKIMNLVALLRHSPKYRWNTVSKEGKLQVASTIDVISSITSSLTTEVDFSFNCETILNCLDDRRDSQYIKLRDVYFNEIGTIS